MNTQYYVRAYATNNVGTAYGNELIFITLNTCGSLTINHLVSESVAPVNKTVTYGTVTNIPGELSKCWITSNLGSDHAATAVDDDSEPSAGWYWQFNRKQGYMHDGTTRTPNSSWSNYMIEDSDWHGDNDPCALELGSLWHIPTKTEWFNINVAGNWTNWDDAWFSGLKLHAAGNLSGNDGTLEYRGSRGHYWSSSQQSASNGWSLYFHSGFNGTFNSYKAYGFSLRCIKN